jgi:predicted DNA binding CopG/RHH family protein
MAKTKTRTLRVSDSLWEAVKEKSSIEGKTITDVIVKALEEYIGDLRS